MSMAPRPLVVIAAGGTGGHVFPAAALAAELDRRGCALARFTDHRGGALPGAAQIDTHLVPAGHLAGGFVSRLGSLTRLARGTLTARSLLRQLRPAAVVGFGGYASIPTMLAATQANLPTVIHEQNAVLGRANRLLASRVTRIATAFDKVARLAPEDRLKVVRTGNPVRPAIAALNARPYPPPDPQGPFSVLILGGSQGARIFSEVVPLALASLPDGVRWRLKVTQQCRPEDLEEARAAYRNARVEADLAPFFEDIPARLAGAHLVICRSGASTAAELTTAGRPAILVPYPYATDDHQTANARAISAAGGGWLVPQPEFTPAILAERLASLMAKPDSLIAAAAATRRLGRPDAAARLADLVIDLLPNGQSERRQGGNSWPQEKAA